MEYKQSTLDDIIDSERQMRLDAKNLYWEYFEHAVQCNILLNNFIKSFDDIEKQLFAYFYSCVKKHHTLALFSAIRLHHLQCGMNLRQVLEYWAWAVYAIGNSKQELFYAITKSWKLEIDKKLEKIRNTRLYSEYKEGSDAIKRLKVLINNTTAHAKLTYTIKNIRIDKDSVNMFFFDQYDELTVKNDLWFVANIAILFLDMFYSLNRKYNAFSVGDDFASLLYKLGKINEKLKTDSMKSPRISKFL